MFMRHGEISAPAADVAPAVRAQPGAVSSPGMSTPGQQLQEAFSQTLVALLTQNSHWQTWAAGVVSSLNLAPAHPEGPPPHPSLLDDNYPYTITVCIFFPL